MSGMDMLSKQASKWFKYVLYTICFWIFIGPLIYKISNLGLAAFGGWDSITQIYQVMLYTSRLIKDFLEGIFREGSFSMPLVEWSLGIGDDVIAALNWHGFGDPFYLLTVLVKEDYLPYFFTILFYFRVYLGGVAFIALAYELNSNHSCFAYVIGALVYSFTGFTVQCNMHLIFVHAMMYVPLLILGAERTVRDKKKGVLTITVLLFALSGFYYLYIGSLALAVYVVYRFIRNSLLKRSWDWKGIFRKIGEMIAEYIIGLGLASIIFVPAVTGFLSSNRASVKVSVPFFMSWSEMKSFWINFFLPQYDNYQVLSICTIGVMCVMFTILSRKRYREKINIALLLFCAFIPMISVVMSGFGECYDRWEVVITLYFAYLTVEMWDELDNLSWIQRFVGVMVYLFLGIYGKKMDILEHERYSITILTYGLILFTLLVILPFCKKMNKRKVGSMILFVLVVFTICKDWRAAARDREIIYVQERDVVSELITDTTGEFYRIDNERTWSEPKNGQNIALTLDYHGISEYVSIENPSYTSALAEWNVSPDASFTHMNVGLDTRSILETLCAVKYLIKRENTISTIPYGFEKVKETEDGEWSLYQNSCCLPVVYTYEKTFDENAYQKMNGFEKQQLMLQAVSVEAYDGEIEGLVEIENDIIGQEYSIEGIKGGVIENNVLSMEAGGKLTISTYLRAGGENYLLFEDTNFINHINVKTSEGIEKGLTLVEGCHNGNIGVNLGVVDKDTEVKIDLIFQNKETFEMSKMKIIFYDFRNFSNYVNDLREESLTDLSVDTNTLYCKVDLEQKKMLCLAVPYSKGWTAYVDGKKVSTYRANDMFIGIEVPNGEHDILLEYETPGLRYGIAISFLALAVSIMYVISRRRKEGNVISAK